MYSSVNSRSRCTQQKSFHRGGSGTIGREVEQIEASEAKRVEALKAHPMRFLWALALFRSALLSGRGLLWAHPGNSREQMEALTRS